MFDSEELAIQFLNLAGASGLPELATDILKNLSQSKITFQEEHFAPLIESYCRAGDVKNAFKVLTIIANTDVPSTMGTVDSIVEAINVDVDIIDRAFFTLQDLQNEGSQVSINAINAVIRACGLQKDIDRAWATYNDLASFKLEPNTDTLNEILKGCIRTKQKDLALQAFADFRMKGIERNAASYKYLIMSIVTSRQMEEAFQYLEEMKVAGYVPDGEVYGGIIQQCIFMNDARAKTALNEMKESGYHTQYWEDRIKRGGERRSNATSSRSGDEPEAMEATST